MLRIRGINMNGINQKIAILALTLFSGLATAAEFPTGTFVCSDSLDEDTVIQTTVTISEQNLGGMTLPVLHYTRRSNQKADITGEGKGLGALIRRPDNLLRLIGPGGITVGINFVISADGLSLTTSGGGTCVKQ